MGTAVLRMQSIVTSMVTRKSTPRAPIPKKRAVRSVKLYLREWRKFMGVSAVDCAIAIDIERESYLRLERETWRVSWQEAELLAKQIGVKSSQLRFPPPQKGQPVPPSLDEMIEDQPDMVRQMAIGAISRLIGK